MKSKAEIETFFLNSIHKELKELEYQRLEIVKKYSVSKLIMVIVAIILAFALLMVVVIQNSPESKFEDFIMWLFVPFILCTSTFVLFNILRQKKFLPIKADYKTKVLAKISKFIAPDFNYQAKGYISKENYEKVGLYGKANNYEGSDLVEGKLGELNFKLSIIKSYVTRKTKASDDTNITSVSILFEGVYCVLNLPYSSHEPIYIKTKLNRYALFAENELRKPLATQHPEFDTLFSLQCDDVEIGNTFISSNLFLLLLEFRKKQEAAVEYYLNGSELHIAMEGISLNGTNVSESFIDLSFTKTYTNYLNDLVGLAEVISKSKNYTTERDVT